MKGKLFYIGILIASMMSSCLSDKKDKDNIAIDEDSLYMDSMDSMLRNESADVKVDHDTMTYYLRQLGNPKFVDRTDGIEWYIAAEELGLMGKQVLPYLIKKLDSDSEYERGQALYALRLASQQDNVKAATGGEFVEGNGMAIPEGKDQIPIITEWKKWYDKYKDALTQ
ncbi:MAG: hypothetical protein ABIV51_14250 [Saprospiraceae bacterium]